MRVAKKVVNFSQPERPFIVCCWDTCERDGVELHKARVNEGGPNHPHIVIYVFCSETHKFYWVNSHRDMGNLPPGYRHTIRYR